MTKQRKMKRENNDDGPHDNKRTRRNENEDSIRILIPSNIAGAIIGKGGMHIQKMRSQYKATVSVDDSQGPERTILIEAELESILQIITEMLNYFEEESYSSTADFRMLIHQSLAGCIIGKGGQKIKEIRDKIGCRILKVFSNYAPQSTDRVVQIIGTQAQIVDAVREIVTLTKDTPIKGNIEYYNPVNFHLLHADEYGGYSGVGTTRPSQRGGGGGGGGGNGGRGGGYDRRGGDRDGPRGRDGGGRNSFINPWSNDFGSNNGGGFGGNNFGGGGGGFGGNNFGPDNSGFGGGSNVSNGNFNSGGFGGNSGGGGSLGGNYGGGSGGGFGNNMGGGSMGGGSNQGNFGGNSRGFNGPNMGNGMGPGNGPSFGSGSPNLMTSNPTLTNLPVGHDPENSTQVTIPKDLAGAIIGKGGGRIRRIRNESNAYITIDEPLPGSNDRIITISGTPKQIQMAQYLLQKSAHENNGRRNF